jgi:hypothetical protein
MGKTVLTFGLIAGAIISGMLLITLPFHEAIGFDRGEIIGYTSMVAAFLLIYFGVRSYRDNVAGGRIGFGKAFVVGALIAVVASVCYGATWQLVYHKLAPDFFPRDQAHMIEEARADGMSEEDLAKKKIEMAEFNELYKNPLINIAFTFIEPMPVALVIALVSAGILSRRKGEERIEAV